MDVNVRAFLVVHAALSEHPITVENSKSRYWRKVGLIGSTSAERPELLAEPVGMNTYSKMADKMEMVRR